MEYVKTCPICGKAFKTNSRKIIYCGKGCADAARRKRDRDCKRRKRAESSQHRIRQREDYQQLRAREAEKRANQSKQIFAKRLNEKDPAALMIMAKGTGGNTSREYWDNFARAEIQNAAQRGTESYTIVNGVSVYEDDFAEKVIDSIKQIGHIYIDTL